MDNSELLEQLHEAFKRIDTNYDTHAKIERIIFAFQEKIKENKQEQED